MALLSVTRQTSRKVAVMWPRLGPYHMARLAAAFEAFQRRSCEVVAVETATNKTTCPWDVIDEPLPFDRQTLFPQVEYEDLPARNIRDATVRWLKSADPDVIAACGWAFAEAQAAIAWGRQEGRAIVLMSDSNKSDYKRVPWKEYVKGRIVKLCDAALVAARPQAEYVAKLGMPHANIFLGYDAVDNDYFQSQADAARRQERQIRKQIRLPDPFLLTVARFTPEKNLLPALQAYSDYVRRRGASAWKWVLCGNGPLEEDIRKLSNQLGLDSHVKLPGVVRYAQLPWYYGVAECFWLPSIKDCFPLVVNEAMASGLPILISTRCGNSSILLEEGGNGWTFDPGSVEAMTDVLLRTNALSHQQRGAMGLRSREIISHWGPEQFAEGLWNALQVAMRRARDRQRGLSWVDRLILKA